LRFYSFSLAIRSFIKLGQGLSVRPDLIPNDAMNELRLLCDGVPSFPSEVAFRIIEDELGSSVDEIFSEFSIEPIAAASLGQVHKGILRSTGQDVAVKVQRPDMLQKVSLDLYCLQKLVKLATAAQEIFTTSKTDYMGLLNEWASGTYKELDYVNEKMNSRKFKALIAPKLPDIYVPVVYDDYTSRKILCMEWINARPLASCSPEEIQRLVNKGVECFLFQLLSAGFLMADPHSGNLLLLDDTKELCVCYPQHIHAPFVPELFPCIYDMQLKT
jgi:predicted unusual protein kinase regulating ubiquinone biosynthesis (AarF/ABC1/UbiB family)